MNRFVTSVCEFSSGYERGLRANTWYSTMRIKEIL
jgi:hypothetical protein